MKQVHQYQTKQHDDQMLEQVIFRIAVVEAVCKGAGGAVNRQNRKNRENEYHDPDNLVTLYFAEKIFCVEVHFANLLKSLNSSKI
jgi:hypothetical protein